ncbi:MAG: PorV/PorQ family protein [Elusimicrobia bacterium]|nr:PorV/PorQ family protein [Elusimicrobiota bacterium]
MRRRALVRLLAAASLLASTVPARAGFTGADLATSGAQFLSLGGGARAAGMGEAYAAVADGADAVYWNPSGLARMKGTEATFTHTSLPADMNYEFAAFGTSLGRGRGLGAAVQYLSQPSIDQTDSSGFATGSTFRPSDLSASVAGAATLGEDLGIFTGAHLGAAVKYVRTTLTKSVYTAAADLGVTSAPFDVLGRTVRVAYAAQNLGGSLKYQAKADSLPITLRLGTSWGLTEGWTLAGDLGQPLDNRPYLAFGTEYRAAVGADSSVAGRVGVNTRAMGDTDGMSGLSFGVGGKFGRASFDYALSPLGTLGMVHRVGVGFSF